MITFNQFPDQIFRFIRCRICYFNLLLISDIVTPFFRAKLFRIAFPCLNIAPQNFPFSSQDVMGFDALSGKDFSGKLPLFVRK